MKIQNLIKTSALICSAVVSVVTAHAGQAPNPGICLRSCWVARAPTCGISQMSGLTRAIIHHTAGAGDYSTDINSSKAIMRGVQNLHINNGWCDIAYHFLVDAAGNIFEGRSGSMTSLPRGTHDGNNSNSFGFTMLGYYHPPYNHNPNANIRSRLYDVIAWRMPSAWSPYGSGTYNGNNVGFLDGHRKVKATACPGDGVYFPFITDNRSGGEARDGVNARKNGVIAPPAPGTTPVTLMRANEALVVFILSAPGGSVMYREQTSPGGAWSGWLSIGGSGLTKMDAVLLRDGRMMVVAGGLNEVYINVQSGPGGVWSGWATLGGVNIKELDAVVRPSDGFAVIFCANNTGAVTYINQTAEYGNWSGWNALGGTGITDLEAVSHSDGKLILFGCGGGAIYHRWQTVVNGAWNADWATLEGTGFNKVKATLLNDNRMAIVGCGNGTAGWFRQQATPNGAWNNWIGLGGTGFNEVDAVTLPGNQVVAFGCGGSANPIWHTWQSTVGGPFSGWFDLDGTGFRNVESIVMNDGRIVIFGSGPGTPLWHRYQTTPGGIWSDWIDFGGSVK